MLAERRDEPDLVYEGFARVNFPYYRLMFPRPYLNRTSLEFLILQRQYISIREKVLLIDHRKAVNETYDLFSNRQLVDTLQADPVSVGKQMAEVVNNPARVRIEEYASLGIHLYEADTEVEEDLPLLSLAHGELGRQNALHIINEELWPAEQVLFLTDRNHRLYTKPRVFFGKYGLIEGFRGYIAGEELWELVISADSPEGYYEALAEAYVSQGTVPVASNFVEINVSR